MAVLRDQIVGSRQDGARAHVIGMEPKHVARVKDGLRPLAARTQRPAAATTRQAQRRAIDGTVSRRRQVAANAPTAGSTDTTKVGWADG